MIDWEKRARELWGGAVCRFPREGTVEVERAALGRAMLQLGREMADARAEEIARACERRDNHRDGDPWLLDDEVAGSERGTPHGGVRGFVQGLEWAAHNARSTIAKPEAIKLEDCVQESGRPIISSEEAIRSDEREQIGKRLESQARRYRGTGNVPAWHVHHANGLEEGAMIARLDELKTREAVLEEALREISARPHHYTPAHPDCPCDRCVARRALEWKL